MDVLGAAKDLVSGGLKKLDEISFSMDTWVGRKVTGDLPDVIGKHWLSKNSGDPRLFEWLFGTTDLIPIGKGKYVVQVAKNVAVTGSLSYGIAQLTNTGRERDEVLISGFNDSDVWYWTNPWWLSATRVERNGYVRYGNFLVKEGVIEQLISQLSKGQPLIESFKMKWEAVAKQFFPQNWKLAIAQFAHESGLTKGIGNGGYNVFGAKWVRKYHEGRYDYVTVPTTEVVNGKRVKINDTFISFKSATEAMNYFANLLRSRYSGALTANDVDTYVSALKSGRGGYQYFTDDKSKYAAAMKVRMKQLGYV